MTNVWGDRPEQEWDFGRAPGASYPPPSAGPIFEPPTEETSPIEKRPTLGENWPNPWRALGYLLGYLSILFVAFCAIAFAVGAISAVV